MIQADITVGTAVGQPGRRVGFAVTLDATSRLNAINICIGFDPETPIASVAGLPDCTLAEAITGTFTFQPQGCTPATDCEGICTNLGADPFIPAETGLFSCRVDIAATAVDGTYPLTCSATAAGPGMTFTTCPDGAVIVETLLTGDCNGDGVVTIDELIKGVNIALGLAPITECPAFDTDGNGQVTIDELIQAVNNAQNT